MDSVVADLPSGPLDFYRKESSFNWKDMVLFIDGKELHQFKVCQVLSSTLRWLVVVNDFESSMF